MRLEYIQHPQDESSDAAVHLVLAPSYVTYNAVTIQHVQEFFKTEEVHPDPPVQACRPVTGLTYQDSHTKFFAMLRLQSKHQHLQPCLSLRVRQ